MNRFKSEYIVKELKVYKSRKADIEIRRSRIKIWKQALNSTNKDILNDYFEDTGEFLIGIAKPKYRRNSPVEAELIKKEITRDKVKSWIKKEQEIVDSIIHSVEMLELGLDAITAEERFIITSKYINNSTWLDIEYDFNRLYRNRRDNKITEKRLRNMSLNIKKKLYNLMTGQKWDI